MGHWIPTGVEPKVYDDDLSGGVAKVHSEHQTGHVRISPLIRHCTYIHTCMYYIHTHTSVHTYIVIHFDIFVSLRKRSI